MKNNDNNVLNNIEESGYNRSSNKDTSISNFVRDLSPNAINKPWYKKKSSIIAMSSTLGVGVLTTAITVPLVVLTSTQSTGELSKVITVYDLNKKTAKLIVEGKNLPNDKSLYSVSKETTAKASDPIVTEKITLNFISASEINLDFADPTINAKTIYQVKLNNGTSSGNAITSNPTDNVKLPTFTITTQPNSITLPETASSQSATFSVTASAITNPISNQTLSYQWKTADSNTTDESKWTIIPNETKATYTYDAKSLAINTKKYFKCVVSYKYANSVTSIPVFVERANTPSINISAEPQNVDLEYSSSNSTTTLSVTASVINGSSGQSLSYQWQVSDSQNGPFRSIQNANSSTYNVANITAGSKKYYKCTIYYTGATSIDSAIVYVEKAAQPVITISGQPSNQALAYNATSATALSVTASVQHGLASGLTYQWQSSSQSTTGFTNIANATSSTYSLTSAEISAITSTASKYFKCLLTYTGAAQQETNVATISRSSQPVITVITNPAATSLTSESTTFTLQSAANVTNQISGQQISYQWQSSTTENGTYNDIVGGTQQNFTKTLESANKNAWRDTWYKCKITYPGAAPVFTGKGLVKMTLTQAEAKAELLKWLAVEANAISVLTAYFNEPIETSVKNTFYKSLHDHELPEGNPTLVVHSITPMPITANASYPTSYKSYKIKLKTTSPANIARKRTGGASTRETYAAGMIIEFNTLFSFGGEKVEFLKADDAKYNMILQPTFTRRNNKPTTTLVWGSDTANGVTAPTTSNPYKKGAYPVKFYVNDAATTPVIDDSVFMPSRLQDVYTSGTKTYLYTMIPTYHIRTTN